MARTLNFRRGPVVIAASAAVVVGLGAGAVALAGGAGEPQESVEVADRTQLHTEEGAAEVATGAEAAALPAGTLLAADFTDDASGFTPAGGDWTVVDGAYRQDSTDRNARAFAGSTRWDDVAVEASVTPGEGGFAAVVARAVDEDTYYYLALRDGVVSLDLLQDGSRTVLDEAEYDVAAGAAHTVRLTVIDNDLVGQIDGERVVAATDGTISAGAVGLKTFDETAVFDDVVVLNRATGDGERPAAPSATPSAPVEAGPTREAEPPAEEPADPSAPAPATGLIGWAAQNGGVTGGGDAAATSVGSADELAAAVSGDEAKVVEVVGEISCTGMIDVGANTTLRGASGAAITGCGLTVGDVRNVIIRNLSFDGWDDDAINVEESTNVWVDHNAFGTGYDGATDVKRGSDFVTLSWNHYQGQDKNALLGHSDDNGDQDRGHLRVSYHHNWFDGTNQRNPRVRFGNPVHVFNNLYTGVTSYGVASTMGAGVLVEGNYFQDTDDPFHLGEGDSGPGGIVARDNHFENSGEGEQGGSVEPIPYEYPLEPAASVKAAVEAGAGPQ